MCFYLSSLRIFSAKTKILHKENVSVFKIINAGASDITELQWTKAIGIGVFNSSESQGAPNSTSVSPG